MGLKVALDWGRAGLVLLDMDLGGSAIAGLLDVFKGPLLSPVRVYCSG